MNPEILTRIENLNSRQMKMLSVELLEIEVSEDIEIIEYTEEEGRKYTFSNVSVGSGLGYNGQWDRYNGSLLVSERKNNHPVGKLVLPTKGEDTKKCKHEFEDWWTLEKRTGFQAILNKNGYWCRKCGRLEERDAFLPNKNWAHIPVKKDVINQAIKEAQIIEVEKDEILKIATKAYVQAREEHSKASDAVWNARAIRTEKL